MNALYVVLGILAAVGLWQLAVWMLEIREKNRKFRAATAEARDRRKPLLIVGGPWGGKQYRHWFKKPAHGGGDFCIDIDPRALRGHSGAAVASVTHIPFSDKVFGAAFASHLLEHLPTVGDARRAMAELNRVAEAVYLVCPSRQSIAAWVIPEHHLWVWQEGSRTFLRQRGSPGREQVDVG
jgi:hypothetical protein